MAHFPISMKQPTVFISYSHEDKYWVRDYLLPNLEKNGIPCHIDYRDFELGVPSIEAMERAVDTCEKTILVFSPRWVGSEWAQFEGVMLQTESPLNRHGRIVPILLEKCDIPRRLKILNYADFTVAPNWDAQLNRVIKHIKKDFEKQEAPEEPFPPLDPQHIDISRLPQTGFELYGRQKELAVLNGAWADDTTNIVSFVAYGGVGKSTLINKWTEKMRWDNYRGAERVYAWSFYSQGTNERVTNADLFINQALIWFDDPDPTQGSAWDKGKRLARLINQHKTLLILDGMEPLQEGGDVDTGKIKDPGLATLIRELAKSNKGLCLITTREHVTQLDRFSHKTHQQNLEHISDEAGRKLLETRRITGTSEELEDIVKAYGNHALAINLLAEYLRLFPQHTLEKARAIPDLAVEYEKGKHARRIIEAFAQHYGVASAEYQLLLMLGLFDRPVPMAALEAIMGKKPIEGLCDQIRDTTGGTWFSTLATLRKHKLLFEESEHRPDTLDCHPIIREHFGEKLEEAFPEAWTAAHDRLYQYFKALPEKHLPDTLEEMEPLFHAVRHGCLAGRYQEVLEEVYWVRIRREAKAYTVHRLGAFSADLSCLSYFFEKLWDKPFGSLTEQSHAFILSWASFRLHALGKLSAAVQPMKASYEKLKALERGADFSANTANLSELYLALGNLTVAQDFGEQSVTFASRSGDWKRKKSNLSVYANSLFQAGAYKDAKRLFHKAEEIQKENQKEYPYLYSISGFRFCGLLLSQKKHQEVLKRSKTTLEWIKRKSWLLDIALDTLTIGKALMLIELNTKSSNFKETTYYLNQAGDSLRKAGDQEFIPLGLLARAALFRHQRKFRAAWEDLDEVWEIASYSGMRLHLTDYHLEAARLVQTQLEDGGNRFEVMVDGEVLAMSREEMQVRFQVHLEAAETLVEETGYHRRDEEVRSLKV